MNAHSIFFIIIALRITFLHALKVFHLEVSRLELLTSCLQSMRSTNWTIPPYISRKNQHNGMDSKYIPMIIIWSLLSKKRRRRAHLFFKTLQDIMHALPFFFCLSLIAYKTIQTMQRGHFSDLFKTHNAWSALWSIWRRKWDSNPWYRKLYVDLANQCLQPLSHSSLHWSTCTPEMCMIQMLTIHFTKYNILCSDNRHYIRKHMVFSHKI